MQWKIIVRLITAVHDDNSLFSFSTVLQSSGDGDAELEVLSPSSDSWCDSVSPFGESVRSYIEKQMMMLMMIL